MLLLKMTILSSLLLIFVQDLKSRSVYWPVFPLLAGSLVLLYGLEYHGLSGLVRPALANLGFLVLQLLLLTGYFSARNRRWTNITTGQLGWGDILFLVSAGLYFSVFNFLLFYMASLTLVLAFWFLWRSLPFKQSPAVPLAGLQALLLAFVFAGDWCFNLFNPTDDHWLLNLLRK